MTNREEELDYQKYLAEQDANKFYAISENMGNALERANEREMELQEKLDNLRSRIDNLRSRIAKLEAVAEAARYFIAEPNVPIWTLKLVEALQELDKG